MTGPVVSVPENLARNVRALHGAAGEAWLQRLPARVARGAEQWALALLPPYPHASYNYVAPAHRADGTPVVLKLCFPNAEFTTELAALRLYDGRGATALLEADEGQAAMLVARPEPGTPLRTLDDDGEATVIAARVMRELWRPVPAEHPFPSIERWGRGFSRMRAHFGGGTGPLPADLVAEAETRFAELSASATERVVLHGDLHHLNILSAQREPWLAIDPKGVVGEPAYEVGALMRNPFRWPLPFADPARIVSRRLDILHDELGIARERLRGWSLAQAVLSAWWVIEDGGEDWAAPMGYAQVLASL